MALHVRPARPSDVPAVAALSATLRRCLEEWGSSRWWRRAEGADEIHPLWLGHLVTAPATVFRVVTDDGDGDGGDDHVVAAAVANPQPGQWFVDDVVVDDGRWDDAGAVLLRAIDERPALTCAAAADGDRAVALAAAGLHRVSRYWITAPRPGGTDVDDGLVPLRPAAAVPPGPPHTFGGSLDPHAPGAIALTDPGGDGGLVVVSPSFPAPPVYDPGGTVAVVDRLTGPDRPRLLDAALGAAARRGDVQVAVVAATGDDTLASLLDDRGLAPIVDVWAWP